MDGTECLTDTFFKIADALPATDANAFFDIFIQAKNNFESFFTSFTSISDLRIFLARKRKASYWTRDLKQIDL